MKKILLLLFIGLLSTKAAAADGAMKIIDIADIPENTFIFGMFDITSEKLTLGYPKSFAHMRGFHFEFLSQLTGVPSPEAMIGKKGQGQYAGFGFIREGKQIMIHPISSMKAAGKIGKIHTVNSLLPKPNKVWGSFLPKDLAEKIFSKLAAESQLELVLDSDILQSERFEFNERKYGSKSGVVALGMKARVMLATRWLGGLVTKINTQNLERSLNSCIN